MKSLTRDIRVIKLILDDEIINNMNIQLSIDLSYAKEDTMTLGEVMEKINDMIDKYGKEYQIRVDTSYGQ